MRLWFPPGGRETLPWASRRNWDSSNFWLKGANVADMFGKAAAYENMMGRWSMKLAPLFTNFAQPWDGDLILDVGCGTGALAQHLADTVRGSFIAGIDPSQAFIDYAQSRLAGAHFAFKVGDAMALPYPSQAFDRTLSLLVLQFVPDPKRAASEMRRVTRNGGVVAACTWAYPGLEMGAIFWEEAGRLDPEAKSGDKKRHRCNVPGQLAEIWDAAGLDDIEEVILEIPTRFKNFDDYWIPYSSGVGPQGVYVDTLSQEQRDALRDNLRKRLLGDRADGEIVLSAKALAVRGRVR